MTSFKRLYYTMWGILENKTNATSHQNIGLLKTAFEKEWNKMSEEFILEACKSFRRRADTKIEKKKKKKKMVAILSKFTVLCLSSYFVVYFLKSKLILFYNRVVYHYTRIFLILLPHPVESCSELYIIKCIHLKIVSISKKYF